MASIVFNNKDDNVLHDQADWMKCTLMFQKSVDQWKNPKYFPWNHCREKGCRSKYSKVSTSTLNVSLGLVLGWMF